jgi:hypothetical protein
LNDGSPEAAAFLDGLVLPDNPEEVVEPDAAQTGDAGSNEE